MYCDHAFAVLIEIPRGSQLYQAASSTTLEHCCTPADRCQLAQSAADMALNAEVREGKP